MQPSTKPSIYNAMFVDITSARHCTHFEDTFQAHLAICGWDMGWSDPQEDEGGSSQKHSDVRP